MENIKFYSNYTPICFSYILYIAKYFKALTHSEHPLKRNAERSLRSSNVLQGASCREISSVFSNGFRFEVEKQSVAGIVIAVVASA